MQHCLEAQMYHLDVDSPDVLGALEVYILDSLFLCFSSLSGSETVVCCSQTTLQIQQWLKVQLGRTSGCIQLFMATFNNAPQNFVSKVTLRIRFVCSSIASSSYFLSGPSSLTSFNCLLMSPSLNRKAVSQLGRGTRSRGRWQAITSCSFFEQK